MNELRTTIQAVIETEPVAVFMKGKPGLVMCGNSQRVLNALQAAGAPVTAVDVLPDPRIRQELSGLSGWPTIPQLFIGGELVGGCDIVMEMYESGELAEKLGVEMPEDDEPAVAEEQAPPAHQAGIQLENRLD